MPIIHNSTTLSGDLSLGAVEIKDHDSDLRAEVTPEGLLVHDNTPRVIGDSVEVNINGITQELDVTSLATGGYPIDVELEARGAGCVLAQGATGVTLAGTNYRLKEDDWRLVTVSGVDQAFFAVLQEDSAFSGVLVATRVDSLL